MGAKERRAREREQRRKQILDAARGLLMEKGLDETSVNQIAKRAELSVGLIYFYFKSKEEIYAALQEEGLDILHDMIKSSIEGIGGFTESMSAIASAYYDFSVTHKNYYDIINHFLSSPETVFPESLKHRIDSHGESILSIVDEVVQSGIKRSECSPGDVHGFSLTFWGLMHGMLQFRKLKTTLLKDRDFQDFYMKGMARLVSSVSLNS